VKRPFAILLTVFAAGAAPAQPEPSLVTPLALRPAREPVPALKYHLLPDLAERTPGNAALLYYRSFSPEWLSHRREPHSKQLAAWENDRREPPRELRWAVTYRPLKEIDLAARRDYCEWELTPRLRKDGIGLLLPDIQAFREFAHVLYLRARFQILDGKFDDAAYTLQTGLSLARDVSNAPTLIQSLVGNALAALALKEVEQWVQTPGAPNLYWALTDLPRPFINLRKPLQGERLWLESVFPGVRDLQVHKRVLSSSEMEKMFNPVVALGRDLGLGLPKVVGRLQLAALAAKSYPAARRALLKQGWTKEQFAAMPVLQAFVLHEVFLYDSIYDDIVKWASVPYPQARAGVARAERRLKVLRNNASLGGRIAVLLLPAVSKVMFATARLDRRIDALRCVEALRLYAAAHEGKLPEKLADVTEVPIPPDPVTGKPFEYRLADGKATFTGPTPAGEQPNTSNTIIYEITLKK
jgi:hypothetical protein